MKSLLIYFVLTLQICFSQQIVHAEEKLPEDPVRFLNDAKIYVQVDDIANYRKFWENKAPSTSEIPLIGVALHLCSHRQFPLNERESLRDRSFDKFPEVKPCVLIPEQFPKDGLLGAHYERNAGFNVPVYDFIKELQTSFDVSRFYALARQSQIKIESAVLVTSLWLYRKDAKDWVWTYLTHREVDPLRITQNKERPYSFRLHKPNRKKASLRMRFHYDLELVTAKELASLNVPQNILRECVVSKMTQRDQGEIRLVDYIRLSNLFFTTEDNKIWKGLSEASLRTLDFKGGGIKRIYGWQSCHFNTEPRPD